MVKNIVTLLLLNFLVLLTRTGCITNDEEVADNQSILSTIFPSENVPKANVDKTKQGLFWKKFSTSNASAPSEEKLQLLSQNHLSPTIVSVTNTGDSVSSGSNNDNGKVYSYTIPLFSKNSDYKVPHAVTFPQEKKSKYFQQYGKVLFNETTSATSRSAFKNPFQLIPFSSNFYKHKKFDTSPKVLKKPKGPLAIRTSSAITPAVERNSSQQLQGSGSGVLPNVLYSHEDHYNYNDGGLGYYETEDFNKHHHQSEGSPLTNGHVIGYGAPPRSSGGEDHYHDVTDAHGGAHADNGYVSIPVLKEVDENHLVHYPDPQVPLKPSVVHRDPHDYYDPKDKIRTADKDDAIEGGDFHPFHYDMKQVPACAHKNKHFYNLTFCLEDHEYPVDTILWALQQQGELINKLMSDVTYQSADNLVTGLSRAEEEGYTYKHYFGSTHSQHVHLHRYKPPYQGYTYQTDYYKKGGYICPSDIYYGRPRRAMNTYGQWKVIVNLDRAPKILYQSDPEGYLELHKKKKRELPLLYSPKEAIGKHSYTQTIRIEKCIYANAPCSYIDLKHFSSRCIQKHNFARLVAWTYEEGFHVDTFKIPIACSCHIDQPIHFYHETGHHGETSGTIVPSLYGKHHHHNYDLDLTNSPSQTNVKKQ